MERKVDRHTYNILSGGKMEKAVFNRKGEEQIVPLTLKTEVVIQRVEIVNAKNSVEYVDVRQRYSKNGGVPQWGKGITIRKDKAEEVAHWITVLAKEN
jgi:hypothetical protein